MGHDLEILQPGVGIEVLKSPTKANIAKNALVIDTFVKNLGYNSPGNKKK